MDVGTHGIAHTSSCAIFQPRCIARQWSAQTMVNSAFGRSFGWEEKSANKIPASFSWLNFDWKVLSIWPKTSSPKRVLGSQLFTTQGCSIVGGVYRSFDVGRLHDSNKLNLPKPLHWNLSWGNQIDHGHCTSSSPLSLLRLTHKGHTYLCTRPLARQ